MFKCFNTSSTIEDDILPDIIRSSLNLTSSTDLTVVSILVRQSPKNAQATWEVLVGLMWSPRALVTVLKDLHRQKQKCHSRLRVGSLGLTFQLKVWWIPKLLHKKHSLNKCLYFKQVILRGWGFWVIVRLTVCRWHWPHKVLKIQSMDLF